MTYSTLRIPDGIDFIETAEAPGGATVTAVRFPAQHAIYVVCSRHGVQVTNVYGAEAGHGEIRAGRTAAVICTQAHARGCTAKRLRKNAAVAKHLKPIVPLADATRESKP